MAFQQFKLDKIINQSRGIFDKYIYSPDNDDTIADILVSGYFDQSRFIDDEDWVGGIMEISAADDFAVIKIGDGGYVSLYNSNANTTVTNIRPTQSGQLFNSSQAVFSAVSATTNINLIMVPSDYHAIQLTWFHRGGGGALVGSKVAIASTDDIGDLLNDASSSESRKFVVPIKDGVTHNTYSAEGWQAVTWSGSDTLDLADSGSDDFTFAKSDAINLSSVPIVGVNAGRFEGYRAIIVRAFAGTVAYSKGGQSDWTSTSFIDEVGPNVVLGGARFGDRVTDLSGWDQDDSISIADDKLLPCVVEAYKSDSMAHSTMVVGDSRFASGSTDDPTREYRNMTFFLQLAATEEGNKLTAIQMAHQGIPQTTYHPRAVGYLNDGSFVENAVYLVHSINDGTPTASNIEASKRQTLFFIDECLTKGVTPILVTAFPLATGYTADQLELLEDLSAFVIGLGFRYFSPLATYGDSNGGWLPGFGTGDSHMTDMGYQAFAGELYTIIKTTW